MFFQTPKESDFVSTAWLAFPILIKENLSFKRKDFQIFLEERNIQTRVVFTGNILKQPMMKDVKYVAAQTSYPNADAVMERGVLLPLHHGMTVEMFQRLHETIDNFVKLYINKK
tara:strand:+ start:188 stop:529 length:342 start_codon:yes stop_codon:yes gene_type:complete